MRAIGLLVFAVLCACGGAPPPVGDWQAEAVAEHPLVGRIWSTAEGRFVPVYALRARLVRARVVLLGEKHDNPDHHRLHGWLLASIAGPDRPVWFEQLDLSEAEAVAGAASPGALARAVRWDESGWPAFAMYAPVFEALYRVGAPIQAAHPDRKDVIGSMTIAPGDHPPELGLGRPLPKMGAADLRDEIDTAHCGHATPQMVEGMFRAQRFKDAVMARALVEGMGEQGTVALIAGNGHVRREIGVPFYLPDGVDVVSLGTLEVVRGVDDPVKAAQGRDFDYVWFTPRVDEQDPCETFAEALERIRRSKPKPAE